MRDPDRIPLILAAFEREWRKDPDARFCQVVVNLLRKNRDLPFDLESRVLFNVEDGQLLDWIGPQTEAERGYVQEEPENRRQGWREWMRWLAAYQRRRRGGDH